MDERLRRSDAHVFVESLDAPVLDDHDDHHLRRVLRLRSGATLTLSDGNGSWAPAALTEHGVDRVGASVRVDGGGGPTLVVAPPKGDRLDWMVQKATEVGVGEIALVECARSVVREQIDRSDRQAQRMQRVMREAAMQARRVVLPRWLGWLPLSEVAARSAVAVAEPGERPLGSLRPPPSAVVIGPEGGFSPAELALFPYRFGLGDTILRVETAAVLAVAALADIQPSVSQTGS